MGVEVAQPIITQQILAFNFTNEGGVGGTFRLLKNPMDLWLVQECRRSWFDRGKDCSYADLMCLAEQAPALASLIVVSDERFLPPSDMPARFQAFCRETGQPMPDSAGAVVRCALESLVQEYRWVAERLGELTGQRLPVIHVVGDGAQNALFSQWTADATGRTVITGPVEATALGTILVQALALGYIASLEEGRAIVQHSFRGATFTPRSSERWEAAYQQYLSLKTQP